MDMVKLTPINPVDLKLRIAEKGLTLRDFSKEISVSHSYVSQILTGKRNPSAKVAGKISNGLGMDLKEIFLISLVDEHTRRGEKNDTRG